MHIVADKHPPSALEEFRAATPELSRPHSKLVFTLCSGYTTHAQLADALRLRPNSVRESIYTLYRRLKLPPEQHNLENIVVRYWRRYCRVRTTVDLSSPLWQRRERWAL